MYGHTHKPFADRWAVAGFPAPVRIFNTGGWMVDTAAPAPVQAGAAVLVSDDLAVAQLQFYRQGTATPSPVQLLPPRGRRAAIGLARRDGIADRPGGGALGVAVSRRGATDRPAPPAPSATVAARNLGRSH